MPTPWHPTTECTTDSEYASTIGSPSSWVKIPHYCSIAGHPHASHTVYAVISDSVEVSARIQPPSSMMKSRSVVDYWGVYFIFLLEQDWRRISRGVFTCTHLQFRSPLQMHRGSSTGTLCTIFLVNVPETPPYMLNADEASRAHPTAHLYNPQLYCQCACCPQGIRGPSPPCVYPTLNIKLSIR